MLITIDEVIGINIDLLSSTILMSPGNFPIQFIRVGTWFITKPIAIKTQPIIINILPCSIERIMTHIYIHIMDSNIVVRI